MENLDTKFLEKNNSFIWEILNSINCSRTRNFSVLIFFICFWLFLIDYYNYERRLWITNHAYLLLFYSHVVLFIAMIFFIIIYYINRKNNKSIFHKFYIIIFSVFWLNLTASISGWIDPKIHGEITVYMFGCFLIAFMLYLKSREIILLYVQSYFVFIVLLYTFQKNRDILQGDYINSSMIVMLSCFISISVSKLMYKYYVYKYKLEETVKELELANNRLHNLSMIDDLTGISNRRNFYETFINEYKRASRTQQPISLLMIDIDYFKNYNDFYGHIQGDNCLKDVAQAINKENKRASDLVARYGGEEFVVLLPNTDLNGAVELGQRIISAVASLDIPHKVSQVSSKVTISLGVGTMNHLEKGDYLNLLDRADKALYRAKESGRNRIETFLESYVE